MSQGPAPTSVVPVEGTGRERPHGAVMVKRVAMAAATAFLAVNIWTGAPLLALWVGSRVVGQTVLSMRAVFVVVAVLALLVFPMVAALAWLNIRYNILLGRPVEDRRPAWLRSMSSEPGGAPELEPEPGLRTTAIERIVVASVYLAVIALAVWFFFLAHSPLPG